jgi:hypothetical protein
MSDVRRFTPILAVLLLLITSLAPTFASTPGDFDGDGDVDTADFKAFAQAWEQAHQPGGTADSKYDLAGDGHLGHNSASIFLGAWLTSGLATPTTPFDGAVKFSGTLPTTSTVSYPTDSGDRQATAYRGQVEVMFKTAIASATAQGLFATYGGTTLEQIPGLGYFLVGVSVGGEYTFISHMRADSRVYLATPHYLAVRDAAEVVVVDGCSVAHGEKVQKVLTDNGVTVTECRDDDNGIGGVVPAFTLWETLKAIEAQGGEPTFINISSSGGFSTKADYDDVDDDSQKNVVKEYTNTLTTLLKAIANLPAADRQNLVITVSAGNDHMPLAEVLATISADSALKDVLQKNILIVGSKGQSFSNYAPSTASDFVWVNNSEATDGTSFAAPYALALVHKIMTTRGVSAADALLIAKSAAAANASHELVADEVLPVLYKGTVTGETTDTAEGSIWKAVCSLNLSLAVSGQGTVADPYSVAMSFDGTLTETLIYCADPPCDPGGTYPVNGNGVETSTGKVAGTATGMEGNLSVTFSGGTFNADHSQLAGNVTITSPFFDTVINKTVTLNKSS